MEKIRVLIADDHRMFREGMRALLEAEPDFIVIGEAEDGRDAVQLARELSPDIILMDIAMPAMNGLEATRQIKRNCPDIKVLALTMHDDEEYICRIFSYGAMGYILKDSAFHDLVDAARSVYRGDFVLSPAITRLIVEDYLRWGSQQPSIIDDGLSSRENEILQLIAEGYTNQQIAEILSISIKTVQAHRTSLMHKLNLHNCGELIKYAIQKKIIEI